MTLVHFLAQTPTLQTISRQITPGQAQLLSGIHGAMRPAAIAALFVAQPQPIVIITDTQAHAEQLQTDLQSLLPEEAVRHFAADESLATEVAVSSPELRFERVVTLSELLTGKPMVVVSSVTAAERLLPAPATFQACQLALTVGEDYAFGDVTDRLLAMGYQAVPQVTGPGEFARRGALIDVFPVTSAQPLRLDFFDEQLDAIKAFDVVTQVSQASLATCHIGPATDFVVPVADYRAAAERLTADFVAYRHTQDGAAKKHATDGFAPTAQRLADGSRENALLPYTSYFYDTTVTLSDYIAAGSLLIYDDFVRLKDHRTEQAARDAQWVEAQVASYQLLPEPCWSAAITERAQPPHLATLYLANFQRGLARMSWQSVTEMTVRPADRYYGQVATLVTAVQQAQERGQTVVLLLPEQQQAPFLQSMTDFGLTVPVTTTIRPHQVQAMTGALSAGFDWPAEHVTVLTGHELFTKQAPRPSKHPKLANAERLKSYNELQVGDYVVHLHHGIGQYTGLETMTSDGGAQDYLVVAYQQNAKIYVPLTQLHLIQKYIGGTDAAKAPRLNKLGGSEWAKTKRQVAAKIDDIADDLLALYAEREAKTGFAFPADDRDQVRFDTNFGYQETPDQVRSIEEIKHDMQRVRPMDRLLVGDVGFGKTEVALRAIFKAAHAGKQVAFLAPTTILVQQHYETVLARFSDFPAIRVGVLSRFHTPKQNKATLAALAAHEIDIIIGTHRLLSKDVTFADLGLLVIDEEQRFGVKHKERLKTLRADVDVLTLTATPIPRTLNMAMVGARDLSVIETPPTNRYPIQTYVLEADQTVIREAIVKEIDRQGQVFYLHNRVADIYGVASDLERLVPNARVAVIHGQMTETQLETVLYDFLNYEYDVLVTTTIIETGVDIANANTLIVENAHHMGLSQLYQLRGRVGRSARLAYAYFTYPAKQAPSEEAEKRLEAIRDFTELGSGFRIAMRDLAIRGAGDLLGKQQHGFIDSVGYDLYTSMLKAAVAQKQQPTAAATAPHPTTDAEIILGVVAAFPDTYVPDSAQKIALYTKIRQAATIEQLVSLETEIIDRFGELPDAAVRLLLVGHIKLLADHAQVHSIRRQKNHVTVTLATTVSPRFRGIPIFEALKDVPLKAAVSDNQRNQLQVTLTVDQQRDSSVWLIILEQFLATLLARLMEDNHAT